jgi:hypothetical protein
MMYSSDRMVVIHINTFFLGHQRMRMIHEYSCLPVVCDHRRKGSHKNFKQYSHEERETRQ